MTYRSFPHLLTILALLLVCGESAAQNTASSDADLSGLTLSAGTLDPAFARDSLSYTATVANSVTSLTVTPTSNHDGTTITVNGASVSSGKASRAISLNVGENAIAIVVTAEDGTTTKTYTVIVARGVNIPDANLRAGIEEALKKSSGAIITPSEMATLTSLNLKNNIKTLTGLEYATNLISLGLSHNNISDISALSGLTNLSALSLSYNRNLDISTLSGLTNLSGLDLNDTNISDISALSGLTNLSGLSLVGNSISDISALSGLTNLTHLNIFRNNISDISALSGLTNLSYLQIFRNNISDISALSGLTSLTHLDLGSNNISDISSLSGLTNLGRLILNGNRLSYPSLTTHIPALEARGVDVSYDARTLTRLKKISGDDQTGTAGSRLPDPIIVEVQDQNNDAFAGVPVAFSIAAGGGVLSTTTATTDANGRASTTLTLGVAGANTVLAAIDISGIDKSATFTTTATGGADVPTNSSDADLSGLTLSAGTLDPAFARDSLSYTATVANSVTSLTVTPTSNHNGAAIAVNGASVSSGTASRAISLNVGENAIAIVVTAEDGTTTKTYTVTVTRGVNIPDANLRAGIEEALKKSNGAIITPSEMATLTSVTLQRRNVRTLVGLEYATNLSYLNLAYNSISDISVLSGLTNLDDLSLHVNSISDISVLSGLTNLSNLELTRNNISDISVLSGLTNLSRLSLYGNNISDISVLSGLTNLSGLVLGGTNISDISVLSGLTNLSGLNLAYNSISDISALSGLTNLSSLNLYGTNISDISALSGLTNLSELWLGNNNISDISALSGLTNLRRLNLIENSISDISALSGLNNLYRLFLNGNSLNYPSLTTHIPALRARGVRVLSHDVRTLTSLEKISGDDQTGTAGSRLSDPLIVEVQDQNNDAFAGVPVAFSIAAGGGVLSTTTTTTDANGRASTDLTLGVAGANTVVAAIDVSDIDKSATFTATAMGGTTAEGAAISSTVPASLTGENLNGAKVNITLTGATYNETLAIDHFALHTAPAGVSIRGTPVRTSATVAQLTLAYDEIGFAANQSLRVTVKAAGHSGNGDLTTGAITVTPAQGTGPVAVVTEPGQVAGVTVTPGVGYLAVSWDVVSGATGYKVQWKSGDELYASERQQVIGNGAKASSTIAGLTAGTEYTVRVIATLTNADDGPPSAGVTGTPVATTQPPPSPPSPPPSVDLQPSFGDSTVTAQRYQRGTTIASLTLPTATGGDGSLTYTLTPELPSDLTFDATTRVLSGTPREAMAETTYTLTATDEDGDAAMLTFTLAVVATDLTPSFGDSTVTAQRYRIGTAIRITLPRATGGDGSLTYTLTPELPSELTFDATTRVLSGTPREVLTETTYTLTATDEDGDVAMLTFTLSVASDRRPSFGDSTMTAQRYVIGASVSLTLPEATGGDGVLVYILLPFLPNGLRFDADTRTISGTPSKALTATEYTFSALDADGDMASLTFPLEVYRPTADVDGNGQVNFDDFLSFVGKFGTRRGDAGYDARYDLDSDGAIGFSDFLIFANSFGTGSG